MTTRVLMTGGPARSEDGLSMLLQGQTYTVSDEYARYLIRTRGAVDVDNVNPFRTSENDLVATAADRVANRALVSRAGNVGAARPVYCSIGNSISAQSGPGYGLALSTEFYSDIQQALALIGHSLQPVRVGGSATTALPSGAVYSDGTYGWSGATSISIAADLPNFMALVGRLDVIFVHTMENDPPSAGTAEAIQAAYDSIINQCLAKGATLIYWKQCLPNTGINTAPELALYWTLRKYMETKAATVSALRIVPTYDLWTDSSNAYPVPLNAGLFANYTDGTVHPRKGALWLGKRLADIMARDGFTYETRLDIPGAGDPGFIAGSANMVGTGGVFATYTGTPATPPAGLTINTNMTGVTVSTANAALFEGRPCIEITAAASAQAAVNNIVQVLMGIQSAGWSVGDSVQFLVEYVIDPVSVPTGFRGVNLELRLAGSVGNAFVNRRVSGDTYNEDYLPGRPVMLATPLLIIPPATTSIRPLMTATSDAVTAVSLKLKVLSFRLINWSRVG